jgi:hypothetical protein
MGILKKIGKVFKKIGKGVKKVFKKFGKFMGKIGIVGNIAMMFILPGIGAALAKGFGAIWTGAVGQTAAQATAAANATSAVVGDTVTQTAIKSATEQALKEGATQAAANAAGEAVQQTALKAATKTAMSAIRAGGAITEQATGMLASELAVVRGAGMVLQKGAQFASTIASGYKTVSQAVTGAFEETGKWIGGKLGMKTAEGAAMKGSWANYSQGVTDSFAKLGDKAAEFWSPIKAGPATASPITDAVTNKAVESVSTTSNFMAEAADTGSGITTDISMPTAELKNQIGKVAESKFTSPTGFDVADPVNLKRSLLDKVTGGETFGEKLVNFKDDAIQYGQNLPGNIAKQTITGEATNAFYDIAGLTTEPPEMEGSSSYGYRSSFYQSNADVLANTMGTPSDFGTFLAIGKQIVPVNEAGYYGEDSRNAYITRMESFTNNPNTGVMA